MFEGGAFSRAKSVRQLTAHLHERLQDDFGCPPFAHNVVVVQVLNGSQ